MTGKERVQRLRAAYRLLTQLAVQKRTASRGTVDGQTRLATVDAACKQQDHQMEV